MIRLIYIFLFFLYLNGCSSIEPAPVVYKITPILNEILDEEKSTKNRNSKNIKPQIKPFNNIYVVKRGDTLKIISQKFNININDILLINKFKNPNKIIVGQKIKLPLGQSSNQSVSKKNKNNYLNNSKNNFIWPVKGKLINTFGKDKNGFVNDGINILTKSGDSIVSVENGEVIYVGTNVRGFGNLLMIRHFDGWVSAYAHNSQIFVNKGDVVEKGQKIANSGSSGLVKVPQLHFELRKGIKPVNPIKLLPPLV